MSSGTGAPAAEDVAIDGARGEGGGQVLRSALSLSCLTGRPLRITRIRARRAKPGLRAQHLAAVRAAAAASDAAVEGAHLGSSELRFVPGPLRAGHFHVEVGTAGAVSLVLQTVLPALARAPEASSVLLGGGTHVPWSPCFEYVERLWLHHLRQMGIEASVVLERAGFHPRGGGRVRAHVRPAARLATLCRLERGVLRRIRGLSAVARLPDAVAERQRDRARQRLADLDVPVSLERTRLDAASPGTLLFLEAEFEHSRACCFGLGARGKRAERVADEAVDELEEFLAGPGAVDRHLADQLLLPLVLADGVSELSTARVTEHVRTNAAVIHAFLGPRIQIEAGLGEPGVIRIRGGLEGDPGLERDRA